MNAAIFLLQQQVLRQSFGNSHRGPPAVNPVTSIKTKPIVWGPPGVSMGGTKTK